MTSEVDGGAAEGSLIRTPDQRVRVFVSSTLRELAAERAAARTAVTRLRLTPVMFELGARPHAPLCACVCPARVCCRRAGRAPPPPGVFLGRALGGVGGVGGVLGAR